MKHPIWKLFLHLAFCCGFALHNVHASPQSNEPEVRQLWQLLDYVAVDYAGAVQNGSVISEMEYKEMQEFSERARSQVIALPPHASHAALTSIVTRLQQAVARKDPPLRVSELARDANKLLLAAYPFPVAPRSVPELSRGATLYKAQCASCHGAAGAGDGPLATRLEPKPIAFTDRERARSRSLMALHQVISQGVADTSMQAFASLGRTQDSEKIGR